MEIGKDAAAFNIQYKTTSQGTAIILSGILFIQGAGACTYTKHTGTTVYLAI